ncbi:MAG: hypothetical protein GF308_15375 [Candidatus Heimdallarchaeota archaeon]|nr:hypothetical protein [Candidatus Heimdallarchaeota archaeon]
MDAQIIISREDNTDFFSIGYIQTDTSLVSALGGALNSFAEEIGLTERAQSGSSSEEIVLSEDGNINFSRFQNGILASKLIRVGEHTPIILIALRKFDGKDEDVNFIVDYATLLAQRVVSNFDSYYTSMGAVPQIDDSLEILIDVANSMYRKSSTKVNYFAKNARKEITKLLENFWEKQDNLEEFSKAFRKELFEQGAQKEILVSLAEKFYLRGIKNHALFPLYFAAAKNPINEIVKIFDKFFEVKAEQARKELEQSLHQIIGQLNEASRSRLKRGVIELAEVELLNEELFFEKIQIAKNNQLPKIVAKLQHEIVADLYHKLGEKYPLRFLSLAKEQTINEKTIETVLQESFKQYLTRELTQKEWIISRISFILQDVTAKFSSNEVVKKQQKILETVSDQFLSRVKKEHPFVILADPTLAQLLNIVNSEGKQLLEKFRTSFDEAVVLSNVIGEIYASLSNRADPPIPDLMNLYFLKTVLEPYQSRPVPEIVYDFVKEGVENTSYGKKSKANEIFESHIQTFETKLGFEIIPETKDLVLQKIEKAKPAVQEFADFETLAFFFKSYRLASESTLTRILQILFGPETFPSPPKTIIRIIEELVPQLQSVFSLKNMIQNVVKRPGGREIFSSDRINFIQKNTSFKQLLPKPLELIRYAIDAGWIKLPDKKKKAKMTDKKLLAAKAKIPAVKFEGEVTEIQENPCIVEKLWIRYCSDLLEERQKELNTTLTEYENKTKIKAGKTSGKERYGEIIKTIKQTQKACANVVTGGGFMRRFFTGRKELHKMLEEVSSIPYDAFREYPRDFKIEIKKFFNQNKNQQELLAIDPMIGNFQDLLRIYASIWMADSGYIDNLEDKLFWIGVQGGLKNGRSSLEQKLLQNLKAASRQNSPEDQKAIIRSAIVEEVLPVFNQNIRVVMQKVFEIFTHDPVVKYDEKKKHWFISFGIVDLPKSYLKTLLGTVPTLDFVKKSNEQTELQFVLTKFVRESKAKGTQSIEEFLRAGLLYELNQREFQALEFLGELTEKYIGKIAGNTFFSNTRILAQLIITPTK